MLLLSFAAKTRLTRCSEKHSEATVDRRTRRSPPRVAKETNPNIAKGTKHINPVHFQPVVPNLDAAPP